jgi:lysozyme family protein
MGDAMSLDRRVFLAGSAMAAILGSSRTAWSQLSPGNTSGTAAYRELQGVLARAIDLKVLTGPRPAGQASALDLAEIVSQALATNDDDAANLAAQAGLLLSELTRDQRDGIDFVITDPVPAAPKYSYDGPDQHDQLRRSLKSQYADLFKKAEVAQAARGELQRAVAIITSQRAKDQYLQAQGATGVPWYVVGALHYREANLNFMGHLHNGDPLLMQTVHVPAKKPPKPWVPPDVSDPRQLWLLSAKDALLQLSDLMKNKDWTVQRMCYGFELYNGFGCRDHGINSPYLWNYTNLYSGGGFPRDHVFDAHYRSRQAGVIAIILAIREKDPDGVTLTYDP